MFSGGLFQATPGMRDALTKPESKEWLEAAQERTQRRMRSTDTAFLQAEIDQLRFSLAALFQLLVAREVFTVQEAQLLVRELEAAASAQGAAERDLVSGTELPPKENPFRGLNEAAGLRRRGWRWWVKFGAVAAGVFVLITYVAWFVKVLAWLGKP